MGRFVMPKIAIRMGLSAACALLGLLSLYEAIAPISATPIPAAKYTYQPINTSVATVRVVAAERSFDSITARSLFTPARNVKSDGSSPDPTSAAEIQLVGVIIDGDRRMAIIRIPGAVTAIAIALGSTILDVTITDIQADHITLHNAQGDRRLALTAPIPGGGPATGRQIPDAVKGTTELPAHSGTKGDISSSPSLLGGSYFSEIGSAGAGSLLAQ